MVKVVDFKARENEEGEEFFVLQVQGGIRPVVSQETGKVYFTINKANVPTTFDEQICKSMIGEELPGSIEKKACDPYDYEIESTGEIIELKHHYEYVTDEQKVISEQVVEKELVL